MEPLLRSGEFDRDELKWLARGRGFPLVGVPPAGLEAVVTRAVGATAAAGERRRAEAVGFLTWPGEVR